MKYDMAMALCNKKHQSNTSISKINKFSETSYYFGLSLTQIYNYFVLKSCYVVEGGWGTTVESVMAEWLRASNSSSGAVAKVWVQIPVVTLVSLSNKQYFTIIASLHPG